MKFNKTKSNRILIALTLVGTMVLFGCTSKPVSHPVAWTLVITKTVPSSIEVDLIPVSEADKPNWENYPPDKYWQAGDPRREQEKSKKTLYLNKDQPEVLSSTDPIWQTWLARGADNLLIMAHLDPDTLKNNPSAARRFLPLDKNAWQSKDRTIRVEVADTQVSVRTPSSETR